MYIKIYMPNDCWNNVTITCKNKEITDELNNLINNELKYKKDDKYIYNESVDMIKCGTRGIIFKLWSSWNPNYEWFESLLDKYPNCWIKNEWSEEGGTAGVWIGFVNNNNKIIKKLIWDDLSLEDMYYLFNCKEE